MISGRIPTTKTMRTEPTADPTSPAATGTPTTSAAPLDKAVNSATFQARQGRCWPRGEAEKSISFSLTLTSATSSSLKGNLSSSTAEWAVPPEWHVPSSCLSESAKAQPHIEVLRIRERIHVCHSQKHLKTSTLLINTIKKHQ